MFDQVNKNLKLSTKMTEVINDWNEYYNTKHLNKNELNFNNSINLNINNLKVEDFIKSIDDKDKIDENKIYEMETKVIARIGQSKFREDVINLHNKKCFITETEITEETKPLVIASHIIAWTDCKNEKENLKLDPHNGIPLISSIDKLFDNHLISFDEYGKLYVSEKLKRITNYESILSICGVLEQYIRDNKSIYDKDYLSKEDVDKIKENMGFHYNKTLEEEGKEKK